MICQSSWLSSRDRTKDSSPSADTTRAALKWPSIPCRSPHGPMSNEFRMTKNLVQNKVSGKAGSLASRSDPAPVSFCNSENHVLRKVFKRIIRLISLRRTMISMVLDWSGRPSPAEVPMGHCRTNFRIFRKTKKPCANSFDTLNSFNELIIRLTSDSFNKP